MQGVEIQRLLLLFIENDLQRKCRQFLYIKIDHGMYKAFFFNFYFIYIYFLNWLLMSKFVLCRHRTEALSEMSRTVYTFNKQTHSYGKRD